MFQIVVGGKAARVKDKLDRFVAELNGEFWFRLFCGFEWCNWVRKFGDCEERRGCLAKFIHKFVHNEVLGRERWSRKAISKAVEKLVECPTFTNYAITAVKTQ